MEKEIIEKFKREKEVVKVNLSKCLNYTGLITYISRTNSNGNCLIYMVDRGGIVHFDLDKVISIEQPRHYKSIFNEISSASLSSNNKDCWDKLSQFSFPPIQTDSASTLSSTKSKKGKRR